MPAASYGATNPGGSDPWPIETELAKQAITSPAMAQMMLGNYQQQRQADANVYAQSMEQQHEYAKQALAQQLTEARMKLIPELVGKPGGGAFLAGGGVEGVGPGAGGNADAWTGLGQAGQQHDFATNLGDIGKGVESLSRSGQDLPIQQIPGLQGYQTTGAGKHSDISVQELKNQSALQLAAIHAAAKAKGAAGALVPGEGFDGIDPLTGTKIHFTRRKGMTDEQWDNFKLTRGGLHRVDQPGAGTQALPDEGGAQATPRATAPPAASPASGVGSGSATQAPSRTSLPRARGTNTNPNNTEAGVAAAQQQVLARMDTMRNHPSYPDLVAGMKANGGKPIIKIEGGKPVLYGASGKPL